MRWWVYQSAAKSAVSYPGHCAPYLSPVQRQQDDRFGIIMLLSQGFGCLRRVLPPSAPEPIQVNHGDWWFAKHRCSQRCSKTRTQPHCQHGRLLVKCAGQQAQAGCTTQPCLRRLSAHLHSLLLGAPPPACPASAAHTRSDAADAQDQRPSRYWLPTAAAACSHCPPARQTPVLP